MLKLREAFSQKIHLHIRQDMLQRLWDKYVPSDAAEYGNIQLVYLGRETGQPEAQSQKIQLLVSLVLKNRIMCMGLEKAPIKTALVREQMKSSLQRMEKYYLMQLKCCDFVMFQKVSSYVELLGQAEASDRRFKDWQKEHQAIEKQREEYRLFSLFSSEMKKFLEERSYEAIRAIEGELLSALPEKEYQNLARHLIWQERETFLSCLEKCDRLQCNKIIKRLEKSSKELSIRLFQSWVTGQEASVPQVQKNVQDMGVSQVQFAGQELAETVRALEPQEYMLFYQRAVSVVNEETADSLVVWKKKKEKMLRYVKRQEPEKVFHLLQQMEQFAEEIGAAPDENMAMAANVFPEKFLQLEEQYFQQVIQELREQAASVLNDKSYQAIARRAHHFLWKEADERLVGESKMEADKEGQTAERRFLTVGVSRIAERIEQELALRQERLEERQAQVFVKYQDAYRGVLGTINHALQEQNHVSQFSEEIFSLQSKGKLVEEIFQSQHRGEFSEEEIHRLCELGRVFAKPDAIEEGQGISGAGLTLAEYADERETQRIRQAISYLREQEEEKQSEFIGNLAEAAIIWEQVHVSARQISRTMEELSGQEPFVQNAWGREERLSGSVQNAQDRTEEGQLQQIVGRITETFWQGAEGERGKEQIQIPEKRIQEIISRRIKGEQGETYLQVTEEKIREYYRKNEEKIKAVYRKNIEEEQREAARRNEEQRAERIFAQIPGKVVQEIFQSQHRGEFGEEEIEKICDLGRVFAKPEAIEEGQDMISYLRGLEEKKQSEFIGNLAESMFIWEQVQVSARQISRVMEELSGFAENAQGRPEEGQLQQLVRRITETPLRRQAEEGQIQQIVARITETFLQGTEGERGKGQIQIPEKRIQKIISRRIKGEQGETYLQVTEKKIREYYRKNEEKIKAVYLKNIEEQKETASKDEEQRAEKIFAQIPGKVVQEIFQSQHRGEFGEEEIEKICDLGRVFAKPEAIEEGQDMISYLRGLEEKKQSEFIGNLAESMFIWEQVHVSARQITRMIEKLSAQEPFAQGREGEPSGFIENAQGIAGEGQLQQIVRRITETFLQGTEGELGKGQIQIPEKKIQKTLLRRINGKQGETYLQITEKKIREFYLKHIEEKQQESIAKNGQQTSELTYTQVLEKVAEEIFQSQHRGEFSEEEIERICGLGRVFAKPDATEEGQDIGGERLVASWTADERETQKMQQAISYLRELEEEKQSELQRMDEAKPAHVPYSKLWEWGRALLFHEKMPLPGDMRIEGVQDLDRLQQERAGDTGSLQQERAGDTGNLQQEDVQTDIIRRQIEAAKDKNNLRQLIVQINHQAFSRQDTQEDILVYADSQLHALPVKDLLRYLRELDERQYGEFVRQMSQVMGIQWQLHTAQEKTKDDAENPQEGAGLNYLQPQGRAEEMQGETYYLQPQERAEEMQGETYYLQPQGRAGNQQAEVSHIAMRQTEDSQRLAAAYPELAVRIQEFERQRHQLTQKSMQAARQEFFYQPPQQDTAPQAADAGELDLRQAVLPISGAKELQYSMQNAFVSEEEQQQDKMRMREETIQMKSAQEQLGKKLQEMETQLRKVETAANAKEDVRAFADQVKRQLYEELHVEKLRRGLI